MSTVIRTKIVKIGNSQGIRIPKVLLQQSGLGEQVEIIVEPSQLVIRPARQLREGWDKAFEAMAAQGDDQLLDEEELPGLSTWDAGDWEWQ